ncbi:mobile element protein [Staphylococcus phage LY01]|nr:mobile element protein [Staphylococcus phage LY01]
MYKSIKIELKPNKEQREIFNQAFGYSRYIYNKALNKWKYMWNNYQIDKSLPKPTHRRVRDELKKCKEDWEKDQIIMIIETSTEDLGKAFNMMWKGYGKYPKFKSKKKSKLRARFYRKDPYAIQIKGEKNNKLKLRGVNSLIKMKEPLNKDYNSIQEVTISKYAGRYFASIVMKVDNSKKLIHNNSHVGIDLGVKDLAIINDDFGKFKKYHSLNNKLISLYNKIKYYQKRLSKKVYGSNKYNVLKTKIQKVWYRINNIKKDYLHKITTNLINNYQYITIEDLQVSNMIKNRKLSKSIAQSNWRQFRTLLEQKAESNGNTIIVADRWFPSTQLCSNCGQILTKEDKLKLSDRWYSCDCGHKMDRDYNAAVNLKLYGKRFVGQAK